MKKYFLSLIIMFLLFSYCNAQNTQEIKEQAIALYVTRNYNEAFALLDNLAPDEKNEEIFLLLANISESNDNDNLAIQNLNKALDKNYTYYRAYYNLGCIFAKKKSFLLAQNNFELAIKYNKNFAPAYYNLACCQLKLEDYKNAKKNLIKAYELDPSNKDCLYNLAYCYKKLNREKDAQKVLDNYNKLT